MSVVPPPGSLTVGGDSKTHLAEPNETPPIPPSPPIPDQYGEDQLLFLVRDPRTLFATWELTPGTMKEKATHIGSIHEQPLTLRVLQLEEGSKGQVVYEAHVDGAHSWYIYQDLAGITCQAQLGLKIDDRFYPILQSLPVQVPSGRESDWVDEDWSTIDEVLERSRQGQYRQGSSTLL